jgi:hypothetical protein
MVNIGGGAYNYITVPNSALFVTGQFEVLVAHTTDLSCYNEFLCGRLFVDQTTVRMYDGTTECLAFYAQADEGVFNLVSGTDNHANRVIVFGDANNEGLSHGHTTLHANPTVYVHSAAAVPAGIAQWISRHHDQTNGVDRTGAGGHVLAPYDGSVYFATQTAGAPTGTNFSIKTYRALITVSTTTANTLTGFTPNGIILGAAIRVSTQVAGLGDVFARLLSLGVGGTPTKYGSATQAPAAITIDVNTKAAYDGALLAVEGTELELTISGGINNIPSSGVVEIEVHYMYQANIPSV